jgi:hypothetical protein
MDVPALEDLITHSLWLEYPDYGAVHAGPLLTIAPYLALVIFKLNDMKFDTYWFLKRGARHHGSARIEVLIHNPRPLE